MKRRMFCLLLGLVIALPFSSHADMSSDEIMAVARKSRNGVVMIMMTDDQGHMKGSATGFLVSKDGKLVTNRHVADAATRLVVKAPNGRLYQVKGVLAEDVDQDVVVLQLEDNSLSFLNLGSTANTAVGAPVVMVGNPLAFESTVQQGTVAGFRKFQGNRRWIEIQAPLETGGDIHAKLIHSDGLQVSTAIGHGSSGSPVIDKDGNVIGVIVAMDQPKDKPPVALAVPVETVKDLLVQAENAEPKPFGEMTHRRGNDLASDADYIGALQTYQTHNLAEAEQHAEAVVSRYPDSTTGYVLLGQICLQRNAGAKAADAFKHAIQINHDLPVAWAGLTVSEWQQKFEDRARDDYRELLKLDPNLASQISNAIPGLTR